MSNKHVARMSLHSLRIHVNPGMLEQGETNVSVTVESYIILAGDLDCFCATIHARERGPNGTATTITTAPNMVPAINVVGLQSDGKVSEPAGMRCQLRNTRHRSISRVSQNYMLAPLAAIIGKSQMVTFTGPVCYYQQIAYLKKRMGPSLVCQNAVQWHSFEQCEVVKEVADAAVKHDELELVVQLYRIVAGILSIKFANPARLGNRLFLMQFPTSLRCSWQSIHFTVEVLLNLACGELKLLNIDGFLSAYDDVERILSQTGVGPVKYTALVPSLVDRRKSWILSESFYGPCPPSRALHGLTPCTQAETCGLGFHRSCGSSKILWRSVSTTSVHLVDNERPRVL